MYKREWPAVFACFFFIMVENELRHKKSNLMPVQRMKNKGAYQPVNFSTLVIRYWDIIKALDRFVLCN